MVKKQSFSKSYFYIFIKLNIIGSKYVNVNILSFEITFIKYVLNHRNCFSFYCLLKLHLIFNLLSLFYIETLCIEIIRSYSHQNNRIKLHS